MTPQLTKNALGLMADAVGAALVRVGGHHRAPAKARHRIKDARVAGRDDHLINTAGQQRTTSHVLNHRQPQNVHQRLTRKPGRCHARRNHNSNRHSIVSGRTERANHPCRVTSGHHVGRDLATHQTARPDD